jgi:hypothetical protein
MLKRFFSFLALTVNGTLYTVNGLLPAARAEDLRDVRPPVDLPPNYALLWLVLILAVAAGLILLIWFLRKRMRRTKGKYITPKTAWELACEQLDLLARENLPGQGKIEEYYVRLSLIVRCYMEARFGIQAPEMTTEEFLLSLRNAPELLDRHRQALREFLNCSDMVKFAKYGASPAEAEEGFALAKRLVEETKLITRMEDRG